MDNLKTNQIKIQEWIVRFDGQIRQSQKLIETQEYHEKLEDLSK